MNTRPAPIPVQNGHDLHSIITLMREQKLTILTALFLCVMAATAYLYITPPRYTATTEIMINAAQTDMNDVRSQAEILKSPNILRRVMADIPLHQHDEFSGSPFYNDFHKLDATKQDNILHGVAKNLDVQPVLGTSILRVRFQSQDADIAAQTANHVVQNYINRQQDIARDAAQNALASVQEHTKSLRDELIRAEEDLNTARNEVGISAITADLQARQADKLKDDYARLQQELLQIDTAQPNDDDILKDYKSRETMLRQEQAELSKKYGAKHPSMRSITARLSELENIIHTHEQQLHQQSQSRKNDIRLSMANITAHLNMLEQNRLHSAADNTHIQTLEAEAEAARLLYHRFLATQKEMAYAADHPTHTIDILYAATPPAAPSHPQPLLILPLSAVTGLFLGFLLALLADAMRTGYKNAASLEQDLGVPAYASLPHIKSKNKTLGQYVIKHPASIYAEHIRSLLATIRFDQPSKSGGHIITLTSTTTGEGKTSTAMAMADMAGLSGLKTILIDANMRRPAIHKHYDIGNARGLSDYLSDRLPVEDVVYTKLSGHVHIMTSKAVPTHALTLLNTDRMEALLRRLRERYDLIIIDTPSAHYFADARVLSRWSDITLYIVAAQKTSREQLHGAIRTFLNDNKSSVHLVLNKVKMIGQNRDKSLETAYLNTINRADDKQMAA